MICSKIKRTTIYVVLFKKFINKNIGGKYEFKK